MAISIIIKHSVGIKIYSLPVWLFDIELYVSRATDCIVPMFYAISGFFFFKNFDYDRLQYKWKSRLKSLVVPYIFWNIIGFLFFQFVALVVGDKLNRSVEPIKLPQTLFDIFVFTKYNITWFIAYLICYQYFFSLIYILIKNKYFLIAVFLLTITAGYYFQNRLLLYAAPYLIGCYLGINKKQFCEISYSFGLRWVSFFLFIVSVYLDCVFDFEYSFINMPLKLLQISLVWIFADVLAIDSRPQWWMTISFFIYCSHSLVLESIEKLFFIVFGNTLVGAISDFVFSPILTLIFLLGIASVIKNTSFIWPIMNGYRNN